MKKKSSKKPKSLKKVPKSSKKRSVFGAKKGKKPSSIKTKKKSTAVKKSSKKVGLTKSLQGKSLQKKGKVQSSSQKKSISTVKKEGKTSSVKRKSVVSTEKRKKGSSPGVTKRKAVAARQGASGFQEQRGKLLSGEEKISLFSGSLDKSQSAEFPDQSKMRPKIPPLGSSGRKASRMEEITVRWLKEELQKIEEQKKKRNLIVKDMEGRDYCLFEDCDFPAVSGEYCRLHYIGRWDYIRIREEILGTGYIEKKINEILKSHSPLFIMYFIKDFRAEKNFLSSMRTFLDDEDSWEEEESLFMKEVTVTRKPEETKEKKE